MLLNLTCHLTILRRSIKVPAVPQILPQPKYHPPQAKTIPLTLSDMTSIHSLVNRPLLSPALLGHRLRNIYLQSIFRHRLILSSARTGFRARRVAGREGLERDAFPGKGSGAPGRVVERLVFLGEKDCWARRVLECGGSLGEGGHAS